MSAAISFVVPAYNEERFIDQCLSAITKRCTEAKIKFELIVIDNGSTDDTADLARQYTSHVLTLERSSVSHARNIGASLATNQLLVFIDGDVTISSKWVETLQADYNSLIQSPLFISGHQCKVPPNGSWIERYWFGNLKDKLFGGANIITTQQAFKVLGGFDTALKTGEDYDFCIRAIDANFLYLDNKGYEAIHLGFPQTLYGFTKREYWHGEGDFKSLKHLTRSPVALIALSYLFIQTFALAALLKHENLIAFALIMSLLAGNLAITWHRFRKCNLATLILNSALNYCYFCARSFSWLRALKNRRKTF